MLKAMRKNVKSLAPTLWIVIAAFIIAIFAVWGGAGRLGEGRATEALVTVGKERISAESYYQALRERLEALKREFRELNSSFIQQLGLPQQVLEQMIQQKILLQVADEMKIRASDREIRERIMSYPVFQKDGEFIGFEEYKRILEWNRIDIAEFEENIRKEVILNKVIQLLTAGITVTPDEVWENYRKTNETVRMDYLLLDENKIEIETEPQPGEIRNHFEKQRDSFMIPEKREGICVIVKIEDMKNEVEVTDAEIEKNYRDNIDQFIIPERIRISRIYLPFGDKEKSAVQTQARTILERLGRNEDFGELAGRFSADDKADKGGDWGLYEWQALSALEQEEIQRLEEGGNSGILELEEGLAILRVTEKDPALTRPLEEVRDRIKDMLVEQKARVLAGETVSRLEKTARKEKSLDVAAQKLGLKVKNTGLLKEGDPLDDLDPEGSISGAMFKLEEKEISPPIHTFQWSGFCSLERIEPPRPAEFEEVEDEVRKEFIEMMKKEKAVDKIRLVREGLDKKDWDDIALQHNLEDKTVDEHKRGQYLSLIGESEEVDRIAFSLPVGQISEPVEFGNGYLVLKVLERKEVTPEDFEKVQNEEKANLLEMERNKFLHSYVTKLREEKNVRIKNDLYLKITSDILSRFEGE